MKSKMTLKSFKLHFLSGIFGIFLAGLACSAYGDGKPAPQQAVETFIQTIQSMSFPAKDPSAQKALTAKADAFLDLESLGKKALINHWKDTDAAQQQAFLNLLSQLIENVAYPRSNKFMGQYQITYPKVQEAGNGYEVQSVIKQAEEALDAHVIYHLYLKEGQWKIDDIVLDDVSIAEDLKYQFDKIIADSKFSGLLDKMRERLTEAEKENSTAK